MTRPYIKLDPSFPERKDYYPDGAWRALVETFCHAEHQLKPGRFNNEKVLKALLGPRAKWVAFLIEQGDLTPSNLGFVYVEGWDEWQEGTYPNVKARVSAINHHRGAQTPAERAFLYRQRKKERQEAVTRDATAGKRHVTLRDADLTGKTVPHWTQPDRTPENASIDTKRTA